MSLLIEPEGDVADVDPSGLPGDTGPNHGYSGLSERELLSERVREREREIRRKIEK